MVELQSQLQHACVRQSSLTATVDVRMELLRDLVLKEELILLGVGLD